MKIYITRGEHPENRKFAVFYDYGILESYRIVDLDCGEIWSDELDTEEDAIKILDLILKEYTLYKRA